MGSAENSGRSPCEPLEASPDELEPVRALRPEHVMLDLSVSGILLQMLVSPWEHRAVLPYLRMLLQEPLPLRGKPYPVGIVKDRLYL